MKKLASFLRDSRVLIGIGIGIIFTTLIFVGFNKTDNISSNQIEEKARNLGMVYPSELKVFK